MLPSPKRYALWLSKHNRYAAFRYSEVEALLRRLTGCTDVWGANKPIYDKKTTQVYREGDTEKVIVLDNPALIECEGFEGVLEEIVRISVSVKLAAEVYVYEKNEDAMVKTAEREVGIDAFRSLVQQRGSFAWVCDTSGKKVTLESNVKRMNRLQFLFTTQEKANLQNPGVQFCLLNDFYKATSKSAGEPIGSVFGRVVYKKNKDAYYKTYALSERHVLGPTTLDNDLAFIMANIAGITQNTVVMDPFCGTGGLLVSATVRGGRCMGCDLDSRVLRGWGVSHVNEGSLSPEKVSAEESMPGSASSQLQSQSANVSGQSSENVASAVNSPRTASQPWNSSIFRNFEDYNLRRPEIVRADNVLRNWRRNRGIIDVILTDPPYGIRAMARQNDQTAAAKTAKRAVPAIIQDLLHTADDVLGDGGRLVFLLPVKDSEKVEVLAEVLACASKLSLSEDLIPCYEKLHGGMGRFAVSLLRNKEC